MTDHRGRSQAQIFAELYRHLRHFDPTMPESAERLDPILRILLQANAFQLAQIHQRLDQTWNEATASLIKSICPESGHWPVPAHTIMRCTPVDDAVEVDTYTRFYYKEEREGGQTFYFSPLTATRVLAAAVAHIYLATDHTAIEAVPAGSAAGAPRRTRTPADAADLRAIYIALSHQGLRSALDGAVAFLSGPPEIQGQLMWGEWTPGRLDGSFSGDARMCPGVDARWPGAADSESGDWGGLRRSEDIFVKHRNAFVKIPAAFASAWEPGPIDRRLRALCAAGGVAVPGDHERFYWIRIDLPPRGSRAAFAEPFDLCFDAVLAVNTHEQALFKHTGGNRLVEIEIPDDLGSVLEVSAVTDSAGKTYRASYEIGVSLDRNVYSLEARGDRLVLWFDFSESLDPPPDSITVAYTVTAGTAANGIGKGKITNLYESHPGLSRVANITPVSGAIPSKTEAQILAEVSARLRQRDRAMTFRDLETWALTFDPRIKRAEGRNSVERLNGGICRCVVVRIVIDAEDFHSEAEVDLLRSRLVSFLKARAAVNTIVIVEVVPQ